MSSMERCTIREVADMSIEDLKRFFAFEADEPEHIDDIVALLEDRRRHRGAAQDAGRGLCTRAAQAALLRDPADLGCRCQTAAAAVRRHSPCGDSRKNNETAYSLSSLWTTRLLPLPPKVQTHLMPSHAAVTGTANALVPVPETLIEANQGFLARQHQAVSPGTARVFDDGAHEAARPPPPAESIRIRALPAHPDRSYRRVVSSAWLHCNSSLP